MPGVNGVIKGTLNGTVTDANGRFTITVPGQDAILVFSFIGYVTQEVKVAGQTTFTIILEEETKEIEEVVVIGYGTVKKSDLTGSVASVKGKELSSYPSTNVMQALAGRSPGVQINQNTGAPGASISVRVRGTNSIRGSNEPLYVVDGFPLNSTPTSLNNNDIESIEVLKDASATAIYGSRGANGVVMITTKKGRAGKTRVEFETSYSAQTLIKKLDLMNAREYANFYNLQQKNDTGKEFFTQDQINGFGEGYDWQDLIFRTAPIFTIGLNVSGGNENTQFSIAGNVYNQDGIVKGSDYDRYSLRANIIHKISKMFSVNLTSTMSRLMTKEKTVAAGPVVTA